MKKKLIIGALVILMAVSLIPKKLYIKDGGSVVYSALLYTVTDVHRINMDEEAGQVNEDEPFVDGLIVDILGVNVYNNVDK